MGESQMTSTPELRQVGDFLGDTGQIPDTVTVGIVKKTGGKSGRQRVLATTGFRVPSCAPLRLG